MKDLERALADFVRLLEECRKRGRLSSYALIGALGVAARGYVRATEDADFLVEAEDRFFEEVLPKAARDLGYSASWIRGDLDDPVRAVLRIFDRAGNEVVDVLPVGWRWQEDMLKDAPRVPFRKGLRIPVPRAEDLVVLKLKAGGPQDLLDAESLLRGHDGRRGWNRRRLSRVARRAGVGTLLAKVLARARSGPFSGLDQKTARRAAKR